MAGSFISPISMGSVVSSAAPTNTAPTMRIEQLSASDYRIKPGDFSILYRKFLSGDLLRRLGKLRISNSGRTQGRWRSIKVPLRHWWQVPTIAEYINLRNTGDNRLTFREWAMNTFLRDGMRRKAISLGCGYGLREIAWAKSGTVESILGVDLTPNLIASSQESARKEGVSDIASFVAADVSDVLQGEKRC